MNALIEAVFNDSKIWKNIGDSHVINVSPAGIIPDAGRLRTLRAHGYACRLYIVLQAALPPPISVLFAFSLLTPGRDHDAVSDPAIIRLLAPHHIPLLRKWPESQIAFSKTPSDTDLMELVVNHFNLRVRFQYLTSSHSLLISFLLP